jgi:hypothetical protein
LPEQGQPPDADPLPKLDDATMETWAAYAKDRFDSAESQVKEFRNWARQLSAAVGVIISLEIGLIGKIVLDFKPSPQDWLVLLGLLGLLVAAGYQISSLRKLFALGYVGKTIIGPAAPGTVRRDLTHEQPYAGQEEIGHHYANGYDQAHSLGEKIADALGKETALFAKSLIAFFGSLVFLAVVVVVVPRAPSTTSAIVAATPTPTPAPTPPPTPAAAAIPAPPPALTPVPLNTPIPSATAMATPIPTPKHP